MKRYLLLGSRIALGVYVPALSLKKQIEALGHAADLICLEDLYAGKDDVIEETKKSFHNDFRLARISYRIPTANKRAVDPSAALKLKRDLEREPYDAAVTFSGFWADFLNDLADSCPQYDGRIYAVHMDAGYSLSWKNADRRHISDIWLYNLEQDSISHMIEEKDAGDCQCRRILVHGGGWGIGEYRSKIRTLNEMGYPLDIIVYYADEADSSDDYNDYYLLDPDWRPDDRREEYPRLLKYEDGEWVDPAGDRISQNPLRELMKRDIAVLSKPGGGTISDSLVSATPVIFGEELAYYEKENKLLWTGKGLGMDFADFTAASDKNGLLRKMRERILTIQEGLPKAAEELI